MTTEEIANEAAKLIRVYLPESYKVYWFGSWISGKARPTSDVDIGILGDLVVPNELMMKIRSVIEAITTLRKIDVVDLNSVSEEFKKNALRDSKIL